MNKRQGECNEMKKKYTIENKNIEREERIAGRSLPRKKFIKLYTEVGNDFYFPPWQFADILWTGEKLSIPFKYDESKKTEDNKKYRNMIDEQNEVLETIDVGGRKTGLIEMKTWRGKSIVIMRLTAHFQYKTLIVCHNKKTVKEMKQKFLEFADREVWVYYSDKKDIKDITVTTHKTFVSKTELFRNKFWLIIIDECDTNLSGKMIDSINTCWCNALFWLSWTPYRQEMNTQDMELIFGPHIKIKEQDNNWYTMIPEIITIKYPSIQYSFEHFHELKKQLMEDDERIEKQCTYIKNYKWMMKLWLLLLDTVQECEMYYENLNKHIDCCIINWQTKVEDDEENIEKMWKVWWVIIATAKKMYRWVDVPMIDHVFLFYPTRFQWNVVQSVGRWLRQSPWKTRTILHDWCDLPLFKWQMYQRQMAYKEEYIGCKISTLNLPRDKPVNEYKSQSIISDTEFYF